MPANFLNNILKYSPLSLSYKFLPYFITFETFVNSSANYFIHNDLYFWIFGKRENKNLNEIEMFVEFLLIFSVNWQIKWRMHFKIGNYIRHFRCNLESFLKSLTCHSATWWEIGQNGYVPPSKNMIKVFVVNKINFSHWSIVFCTEMHRNIFQCKFSR